MEISHMFVSRYAEHYQSEMMHGGVPCREEPCKRRFYDANNVWTIFQGSTQVANERTKKRSREAEVDSDYDPSGLTPVTITGNKQTSEAEVDSDYDPREFMSCFFTSLIDSFSWNDDTNTRDAFDNEF